MSRAYEIRVKRSLVHHRRVEDGIEARLELLPIAAPERTSDLLAAELAERGWEIVDGVARRSVDGVVVEVDTTTGTVALRAEEQIDESYEVERTRRVYEERADQTRNQLADAADAELAARAAEREQEAQDDLAIRLEGVLTGMKAELDEVSNGVNRSALRERAAQMGEIIDVAEDPESGEMTIRVKV
ncbi:MAG TPA: hypothetical protein ENK18_12945 [Deltaproteobacteria bacterium]|nr:hypothetical protein [Deltaproteobacteria bacterium]